MSSAYSTIADDIEWLRDKWWLCLEVPSDADLRRGSATLRRLLVDGMIQLAWRHHRFRGQTTVCAPDVEALAARKGLRLEHAACLIAGGGAHERPGCFDDRGLQHIQPSDR